MTQEHSNSAPNLPEEFAEFLSSSRTGYVYAGPDGKIIFSNPQIAKWLQTNPDALIGSKLSDHFPIARKVYYETHLAPLLRMQGHFDEVALDLVRSDGAKIPVFLSAAERHDSTGTTKFVCFTLFPGIERRQFERNLMATKTVATTDNSRLREQVAEQAREKLKVDEILSSAQEAAALREQFIAVLGHDLRNPLAAIDGAMRLLLKTPLNERAGHIVGMVQQSIGRMAALIDNVMDFARGRLGQGIQISARPVELSKPILHIVEELQVSWPDREIRTDVQLSRAVYCDSDRIGQLLSNLVANALTHGAADGPIRVQAKVENDIFTLSVSNSGDPIPPEAIDRLFEPFTRHEIRPSQQGLGLGLYICAEIARAHSGTLRVQSTSEETSFTFEMPASQRKLTQDRA